MPWWRDAAAPARRGGFDGVGLRLIGTRYGSRMARDTARGKSVSVACPYAETETMRLHLDEIGRHVADGAHARVAHGSRQDRTAANLDLPHNVTPPALASLRVEPGREGRTDLHANWLSNRVSDTNPVIGAACEAWLNAIEQPFAGRKARSKGARANYRSDLEPHRASTMKRSARLFGE